MTYWQFHLVFTFPAIAVALAAFLRVTPDTRERIRQTLFIVALAVVALVYTTPWDNYLVKNAVWTYGVDRVSMVIGYVPIEEYAFFVLQPFAAGFLLLALRNWIAGQRASSARTGGTPDRDTFQRNWTVRLAGTALLLLAIGATLSVRDESWTYLRLIVGWSFPPIAIQWIYGGDYIVRRMRLWIPGVVIPTLYFGIADRIAIGLGIWDISAATSTGTMVGGLPIEELLFFFVTNVLVVQGLMLLTPYPKNAFRRSR